MKRGGLREQLALIAFGALAVGASAVGGCTTQAYCFECETGTGGTGGSVITHETGGAAGTSTIHPGGAAGKAGSGGGLLGNCSGANLETDPANCGTCGHTCDPPASATPACMAGKCEFTCADNYYDLDGDLQTPGGNGCEYYCTPQPSMAGMCTGVDALCKGPSHKFDGCNFQTDPNNCGSFGHQCLYANGMGSCVMGMCQAACEPGFGPDSTKPLPNCECVLINGGKDTCGHDNNCDGKVEPDNSSDPENCGTCGHSCDDAFANAVPTCQKGMCVLGACYPGYTNNTGDPQKDGCNYDCSAECNIPFADVMCNGMGMCTFLDCKPGHYDLDMNLANGCEYSCTPTGVMACNGKDNKCDGKINEGFDVSKDPKNCGVCGCDCGAFFPGANTTCDVKTPGTCDIANCALSSCPMGSKEITPGSCYQCPVFPTTAETCNGKDDDCDGIIDDNLTDAGATCMNTGLQSACAAGTEQCLPKTAGDLTTDALSCVPKVLPTSETCNGVDDDCDGVIDNAPNGSFLPGVGDSCGTSNQGTCKFGLTACVNGAGKDITKSGNAPDAADNVACLGAVNPGTETCNGKDDDCNGIIDDNLTDPTLNMSCGTSVGLCKAGVNQCVPASVGNPSTDALVCVGSVGATPEICDGATAGTGQDENCNGMVDEGCVFAVDAPVRLDTNGSTQGQFSSFSLATASVASEYVVAYADERSGNADIYVRTSTDAGSTWGANDVAAVNTGSIEVEPAPFMRAGRAYVAYSNFNGGSVRRPYVTAANSPYTAWSAGVKVHDPNDTSIDCYAPAGVVANSAAGKDWLAVVWSEIGGTAVTPTRDIKLSYSKDSGATWSAAIEINAASVGKAELPVIATDGAGKVFVTWRDKRTVGIGPVYFGMVDLTAATPAVTTSVPLQNITVANATADQITIAANGSEVVVAWVDLRDKAKTIRVASSGDGGTTWTKIAGVNDGNVIVDASGVNSDAAAPSIAVSGTNVIAAWEDTRSGESDIRFNHSTDGGVTWQTSNPRVDTGDGAGATTSSMPQVAFGTGNHVFVAWEDMRFPASSILGGESLDGGATWQSSANNLRGDADTTDPSNMAIKNGSAADSQSPALLASSATNHATLVWIDFRDANGNNGTNGDIWTRLLH